jgi:2',3'-cyclic-nucleotide 2'-phosphodiesterase (5'-nucleotidase family)
VKVKMAEVIGEATDDAPFRESVESPGRYGGRCISREGEEQRSAPLTMVAASALKMTRGTITWGNAFEVLPFQNTLVTVKLTGAQLKKTLERGLVNTVGMVAISGLRVQFDKAKPAGQQVVSALLSDGTMLDDSKLYSVTTNDFVLAGGDGFNEFGKGTEITDSGVILRDVFVEYIKRHRVLSPRLDGRIVVN